MSSRDKTIMRFGVSVSDCCRVREEENVSAHERWACNDEGNGGRVSPITFFFLSLALITASKPDLTNC